MTALSTIAGMLPIAAEMALRQEERMEFQLLSNFALLSKVGGRLVFIERPGGDPDR